MENPKERPVGAEIHRGGAQNANNSRAESIMWWVSTQIGKAARRESFATASVMAPSAAATTTAVASKYLAHQVHQVAEQMEATMQTNHYGRIIILVEELLQGGAAEGFTPSMICAGVPAILKGCVNAMLAQKEHALALQSAERSPRMGSSPIRGASPWRTTQKSASTSPPCSREFQSSTPSAMIAAPIESLLPPLIDQAFEGEADSSVAWENYMATVRAATTVDEAAHTTTALLTSDAAANRPAGQHCSMSGAVLGKINSIPAAILALIQQTTAHPLICLGVEDQKCTAAAVEALLAALIETLDRMPTRPPAKEGDAPIDTAFAVSVHQVRLAVLRGISSMIKVYLRDTTVAQNTAAPPGSRPSRKSQKSPQAPLSTIKHIKFDATDMLRQIVLDWARLLRQVLEAEPTSPHRNKEKQSHHGAANDDTEEDEDSDGAPDYPVSSPAEVELRWLMEITHQLFHVISLSPQLMSPPIVPMDLPALVLRTLARYPDAELGSQQTTKNSPLDANRCIDVLWDLVSFAPATVAAAVLHRPAVDTSEQKGSEPDVMATNPMEDFLLALVRQLNENHGAEQRERRDDLVLLLSTLLREDTEWLEDKLQSTVVTERARKSSADFAIFHQLPSTPEASKKNSSMDPSSPNLSLPTIEAINAIVALLFELACGAELSYSDSPQNSMEAETQPPLASLNPLISNEVALSCSMRFLSISTSAARRKTVIDLKRYGWQLLEVHCTWQLAYLAYYTVRGAADEEAMKQSLSIQESLAEICLYRLGFLDVLLMYVDTRNDHPVVISWTREELIRLEAEAWCLLSSMIFSSQHLSIISGGVQVSLPRRRHKVSRRVSRGVVLKQAPNDDGNGQPYLPSAMSPSPPPQDGPSRELGSLIVECENTTKLPADAAQPEDMRTFYGGDTHFIAAGGVTVVLQFLQEAPQDLESMKQAALVALCAIARACSAQLSEKCYSADEIALVQATLTQYAPSLIPFLLGMLKEVDNSTDAMGILDVSPPLISSAIGSVWNLASRNREANDLPSQLSGSENVDARLGAKTRWHWLSQSAYESSFMAWSLLRSIGDLVLSKVGMLREVTLLSNMISGEDNNVEEDERDTNDGAGMHASSPTHAPDASLESSTSSMGPPPGDEGPYLTAANANATRENTEDVEAAEARHSHQHIFLASSHAGILLIPGSFAENDGIEVLTSWMQHVQQRCEASLNQVNKLPLHPGKESSTQRSERRIAMECYKELLLQLLDVFRALVLGCEDNESSFVEANGVSCLLNLIELCGIANGTIDNAVVRARQCIVPDSSTHAPSAGKEAVYGDILQYAVTLLADLLDCSTTAVTAFGSWRSERLDHSPLGCADCLIPNGSPCNAVQLLLSLWASELPPLKGFLAPSTSTGLELLQLQLRPALRAALKQEYIIRLVQRRMEDGSLDAAVAHSLYKELLDGATPTLESDMDVLMCMDAVSRAYTNNSVSERIATVVEQSLGICSKVHACLDAVGFDALGTTVITPSVSLHLNLSPLERSYVVQVAALPSLCIDEVSAAMADVALQYGIEMEKERVRRVSLRPTSPDQMILRSAQNEASSRASELNQIIQAGCHVEKIRELQLYNRFLVTRLRQPLGCPADGRPGAVKGAWKSQRRFSATVGSAVAVSFPDGTQDQNSGTLNVSPSAVVTALRSTALAPADLAAQLNSRLTEGERTTYLSEGATNSASNDHQFSSSEPTPLTVLQKWAQTASADLSNKRIPYGSLMDTAAVSRRKKFSTTFTITPPPRSQNASPAERRSKRQAMIAQSLKKLPQELASSAPS